MNRFNFSIKLMEIEAYIKLARANCFKENDSQTISNLLKVREEVNSLIHETVNIAETQICIAK